MAGAVSLRTVSGRQGGKYRTAEQQRKLYDSDAGRFCRLGDACIIVPMAMYRKYGDVRILEENYEMMKNWYAFLESRAENNAIQSGIDYGECASREPIQ